MQLPDKPSELLKLALQDLELVENQPNTYSIDMGVFHLFEFEDKICYVCLAGAVMSKTLEAPVTQDLYPRDYRVTGRDDIYRKLTAIDRFRIGLVEKGLYELGYSLPDSIDSYQDFTPYSDNKKQFKEEMRSLIKQFEEAGL